jgi:hypothetical protein
MKNYIKIFIFLFLGVCQLSASDPRDFVGGLFCLPTDSAVEMMNDAGDRYEDAGYENAAENFHGFSEGWYGSGFLVKNHEGNVFMVTNKHVAGIADDFTVKFETSGGDIIEFTGSFPVYEDFYLDLALIDVPDEEVTGLVVLDPYTTGSVSDGDDIFSAGYPMLLGDPAWQLSKGVVTNKLASVNGIINSEYTRLIQHSAAIDPGNSGGPLLIKQGDEWIPLGVNTWSVTSRNDTYFAIPFSRVTELMDEFSAHDFLGKHDQAVTDLTAFLNREEWDTSRIHSDVSLEMNNEYGWNAFQALLEESDEVYEEVGQRFGGMLSPYGVMRESTLWWVWHVLKIQRLGEEITLVDKGVVPSSVKEGDVVVSVLNTGDTDLNLSMRYYRGDWYIDSIDFLYPVTKQYNLKKKKTEKKKESNEECMLGINLYGATASMLSYYDGSDNLPMIGVGMEAQFRKNHYFSHGFSLYYISTQYSETDYNYDSYEYEDVVVSSNALAFDYGLTLGYPFAVAGNELTPFVEGAAGAGMALLDGGDDEMEMIFYLRYGGGFRFELPENNMGFTFSVDKRSGSRFVNDTVDFNDYYVRLNVYWVMDVFHY